MSDGIYIPYFYIIQEVTTGIYYAGSKWGKDANPENFMKEGGYTTSSNLVNNKIKQNGIDCFIIRKIRIFQTADDAEFYEKRFLLKVDAANNINFYNGHNGDLLQAFGSESYYRYMTETYGVRNPMHLECFKKKLKETNIKKYGVENVFQSETFKNKIKETNLKKYGVEYAMQSKEIKDKIKITKLERYEDEYYNNREKAFGTWNAIYGGHPMKTENIKKKVKSTNLKKYGNENYYNTEKYKETCLEKYGVENLFQHHSIKEKIKSINLERYGAESFTQTEQFVISMKSTKLERYGNENYNNSNKIKSTKLERYGAENYNNRDKAKETFTKKYGVDHFTKTEEYKKFNYELKRNKSQRIEVKIIKKYVELFGVKLKKGWYQKRDEDIKILLQELIDQYGTI
jgi:hypothetical protein